MISLPRGVADYLAPRSEIAGQSRIDYGLWRRRILWQRVLPPTFAGYAPGYRKNGPRGRLRSCGLLHVVQPL